MCGKHVESGVKRGTPSGASAVHSGLGHHQHVDLKPDPAISQLDGWHA